MTPDKSIVNTEEKFDSVHSESDEVVLAQGQHVTWIGFWVNAVLGVLKILAGVFGRSSAMLADGVHSFSDFFSDIIVLVFIRVARQKANARYQYGHGKFETLATLLLALILALVGVGFFVDGVMKIIDTIHGEVIERPGWIAFVMAVVSIGAKEWVFRYTKRVGERINSAVVVANAWHHRSDALSSVATVVGIGGAILLGPQWHILDPIAAMVVSVLVIMVAIKIGQPAVLELLEVSLPKDIEHEMFTIIGQTLGVEAFHHFASRRNGNTMIVDFHIKVRPDITVEHAHEIAEQVENRLYTRFGNHLMVTIHIEPYHGQKVDSYGMCE